MPIDHDNYSDAYIRSILEEVQTIAIVGASANTVRPSYFVLTYMMSKGYDVAAVNPGRAPQPIAGAPCFASLAETARNFSPSVAGQDFATSKIASPRTDAGADAPVENQIDLIDIFRNSQAAYGVVEEVLQLDPLPKVIWMQLGVRNDEAARMAEKQGIKVIMNRCPKIEYARLCGEIGWVGVNRGIISAKKPKLRKGYQRFDIRQ